MKTARFAFFAITSITLALVLDACSMLGTDIMDRINSFATGLNNSDRSTINANFDQALTMELPTMTAAWWTVNFPAPPDSNHQYSISLIDYSSPSNVVATISGPPAFSATASPVGAVFVMTKEGPDWFIEQLYLGGSSTPFIQ